MGFEQLQKAVLDKASRDADKITKDAQAQAKTILDEARRAADAKAQEVKSGTKRMTDLIEMREIASARLEAKKTLLLTRKDAIDSAFAQAAQKAAKLPKAQRKALVESLLKKAGTELDVGTVYCNSADTEFIKGAKAKDMAGGIIVESKDKTTMVDYSFETLLAEIKEKNISEISGILFK